MTTSAAPPSAGWMASTARLWGVRIEREESDSWKRDFLIVNLIFLGYSTSNTYPLGKEEMPIFSCYFMKEYFVACSSNLIFVIALLQSALGHHSQSHLFPRARTCLCSCVVRFLQAQRTPSNGGSLTEEVSHAAKKLNIIACNL